MKIEEKLFGRFENKEVKAITLTNSKGVSITAIPYGAHIIDWTVPDKDGNFDNIVLGLSNLDDYVAHRPFYGATVGRVAGRIADGRFSLDGKEYNLPANNSGNHLHGGPKGLDAVLWNYKTSKTEDEATITFSYVDEAGSNNYPGTLTVEVQYTLTEENEWKITYSAETDEATLFNPTNHVYFNLHGDVEKDILDHSLYVNADSFIELNDNTIPTGNLQPVDGTPFDFRDAAPLAQATESDHPQTVAVKGLDHPFVLNHEGNEPDAILLDKDNGRRIIMKTDQPSIVVFMHNGASDTVKINNQPIQAYAGVTLETQGFPDAINQKNFGNTVLRPGEKYFSETTYQFHLDTK